jgi:hypothetical protein
MVPRNKLTKEIVNERLHLDGRGIQMIGDFHGVMVKSKFSCTKDHEWLALPNGIMSGKGCPHCAGQFPLSKEIINHRLALADRGIQMTGVYSNNYTITEFECSYGHNWLARPNGIMSGKGCPQCSLYGYKTNKPGYLYLLNFGEFIKYGITNNLKRRLQEHKKNGKYSTILTQYYDDGNVPKDIERKIKNTLGGKFVTEEVFEDGWTETLSISKIDEVLKIIDPLLL